MATEPLEELPGAEPLRILVVDDNRDSASSLGLLLQIMGNTVRVAYNGAEALEVADGFRPNAILLDIGLPKVNGYEVARTIRSRPWGEQVVLVAVTGWGNDDARRSSTEAGFDHHLVKPFDPAAVMQVLRREVANRAPALRPAIPVDTFPADSTIEP